MIYFIIIFNIIMFIICVFNILTYKKLKNILYEVSIDDDYRILLLEKRVAKIERKNKNET